MLSSYINTRIIYLSVFLVCCSLLGFGLYLEYAVELEPCPLCVFQRIAYICIALVSLVAAIHGPKNIANRIYSGLILLAALTGGGIAARQVWLQHLPPEKVPECGPGLEYMLDTFPLGQALKMILSGSGECAKVDWTFLGLSIAEWSLIWFVMFMVISLVSFCHRKTA